MADRLPSGMMANRHDSVRLRGFGNGLTDRQKDGWTFGILVPLSRLKYGNILMDME